MKSFRHSFRLLLSQQSVFFAQLWRPYLALSLSTGLLFFGLLRLFCLWGMPLWVLHSEGIAWEPAQELVGIDVVGLLLFLLGFLACVLSAIWGHRSSVRAVAPYARDPKQAQLSGERHLMRLTLCTALILVWLLIWTLPLLNLALGLSCLVLTEMQGDAPQFPISLWLAVFSISAMGMLVMQLIALYVRLVLTHRAF